MYVYFNSYLTKKTQEGCTFHYNIMCVPIFLTDLMNMY